MFFFCSVLRGTLTCRRNVPFISLLVDNITFIIAVPKYV
jgi:hypothetical protein